jgi:hypothetical protein
MDTPWWTRGVGQEAADKLRNVVQAAVPLRVASRPEDIAEVVTFLAGPGSRHMTGAIVPADAGFHVLVPITPVRGNAAMQEAISLPTRCWRRQSRANSSLETPISNVRKNERAGVQNRSKISSLLRFNDY